MKNIIQSVTNKLKHFQKAREKYDKKIEQDREIDFSAHNNSNGEEVQKIEIDVPLSVIIKILLVIVVFWFLQEMFAQLQTIIVITAISFFLATGLSPIIDYFERFKIPRPLIISILYLLFFGAVTILFIAIIPIIAEQLLNIADDLKAFISAGGTNLEIPFFGNIQQLEFFDPLKLEKFLVDNLSKISENLGGIAGSTMEILSGIFQGFFNLIFSLVLIFFILMEKEKIGGFTLLLFPPRDREYIIEKSQIIQTKMAEWFRGQIILMLSVGLFMYIGMKILEIFFGMKYAATIGKMAGFMELFPYIGVLVAGAFVILIAMNISGYLVILSLAWIALTQFLEGNVLVPIVMEKVTGLSSVVVILALAIGGILGNAFGGVALSILGMILAIPVAASVAIFVEEYANRGSK